MATQPATRYDLWRMTMADLYKEYGLNEDTIDFIGHSLALHRDDAYLSQVGRRLEVGGWRFA